jgi:hypothetical protein
MSIILGPKAWGLSNSDKITWGMLKQLAEKAKLNDDDRIMISCEIGECPIINQILNSFQNVTVTVPNSKNKKLKTGK